MMFPKPEFQKHRVHLGALAAIGPAIAVGGSIFSGMQQSKLAAAQLQVAMRQQQELERQARVAEELGNKQMALALRQEARSIAEQFRQEARIDEDRRRQYQLATAGTQDIRGNKTQYIPGQGWVTTPSEGTAALIGASDAEERQRLTTDAQRSRRGKQENERVRLREGGIADTILRQLESGIGEETPEGMQSKIAEVLLSSIDDKSKFAKNAIATQAIRSGEGASADKIAAAIDENSRTGVRSALAQARYDAPTEANRRNTELRDAQLNRYNLLASRAGNVEDVPFNPTGVGGGVTPPPRSMAGTAQANVTPASAASGTLYGASLPLNVAAGATRAGGELLSGAYTNYMKNQPNYGLMAGGINEVFQQIMREFNRGGGTRSMSGTAEGSTF